MPYNPPKPQKNHPWKQHNPLLFKRVDPGIRDYNAWHCDSIGIIERNKKRYGCSFVNKFPEGKLK